MMSASNFRQNVLFEACKGPDENFIWMTCGNYGTSITALTAHYI